MTYNIGIPASGNTPAHDQPLMMQNTNQIAISYNTDHVPLNSGSTVGQHVKVSFSQNGTQALPLGAVSVLNMLVGTGSLLSYAVPNLVSTDGATPLTLPMLPDLQTSGTNFGFKFGQLIFNFGSGTILSGATDVSIPYAISFLTGTLVLQISKNQNGTGSSGSSANIAIQVTDNAHANAHSYNALPSGNLVFYYLAIGN